MTDALRKYGIFFIIPALVLVISIVLKWAAGPYWLATNLDPSYQYLANGVYLIKGYVPNHADHPGTPLQLLCAAVFWLLNIGRPAEDVALRVLSDPEFYLHAVFAVIAALSFATSAGLAVYVHRKSGDIPAALLTQLPALWFLALPSFSWVDTVIPVVANVSPEPLVIVIINLFNLAAFMVFFDGKPRGSYGAAAWLGFLGGLGVAVKLNFLPLLAFPLFFLPWKEKSLFAAVCVASFVLWTFPIISKYPDFWQWASGLVMHTGNHGSGEAGVISWLAFLTGWGKILRQQPLPAALLVMALAWSCVRWVRKSGDRKDFFVLASALAIFLQFALVAKHPGVHYVLPGLGLFSGLLVFSYFQWQPRRGLAHRGVMGVIVLFWLIGLVRAAGYYAGLSEYAKDTRAFHEAVREKYRDCFFVGFYRSSGQDAALFFGDDWKLTGRLGDELSRIYPQRAFFHPWGYLIHDYQGRVWSDDLLARSSCVVFEGDQAVDLSQGPYVLRPLEQGHFQGAYLLTGTTEKKAAIFLASAVRSWRSGDLKMAFMAALQARALHYQPAGVVDQIIEQLTPYVR